MNDHIRRNDHIQTSDERRTGDYAYRLRQILKVRCVHLWTKTRTYPLPEAGENEEWVDTAIWWCGRTGEALGPHGDTACPGDCDGPGRRCYEPPVAP